MSCYKCDWLGVMAPCPHEGEPFPIRSRSPKRSALRPLDVVRHIELGVMDDDTEEAEDFDAEVEAAPAV